MLQECASEHLPQPAKQKLKDIWSSDREINRLIDARQSLSPHTSQHKNLTKQIKKRVIFLKNEKFRIEAEAIDLHANRREIEELYRAFKNDGTVPVKTNACDPLKLIEFFKGHFNPTVPPQKPSEISEPPNFTESLKEISKANPIPSGPPDLEELKKTIKSLKNNKSSSDIPAELIKAAAVSDIFIGELHKLLGTVWESKKVPESWAHSRLEALWKGSAKGSAKTPSAYEGGFF